MRKEWILVLVMAMVSLADAPIYGGSANQNPDRGASCSGMPHLEYLDQGKEWESHRKAFYNTPSGNWNFPEELFKGLKRSDGKLFSQVWTEYGFIVDPERCGDLPIGVIRSSQPHSVFGTMIGITCAVCHTGHLDYIGEGGIRKKKVIDGGAGMVDLDRWPNDIKHALAALYKARPNDPLLKSFLRYASENDMPNDLRPRIFVSPWGFGRNDAYGRGGNTLFSNLLDDKKILCPSPQVSDEECTARRRAAQELNLVKASAPVNMPSVWEALNWEWVQYNASIHQPMGRNIAQAATTSRLLDYNKKPSDPFDSQQVDIKNLNKLEQLAKTVKSPKWPFSFAVNHSQLKEQGQYLFERKCKGCHSPSSSYNLRMFTLEEIGTDPNEAVNFHNRTITFGPKLAGAFLKNLKDPETQKLVQEKVKAVDAMRIITQGVMENEFERLNLSKPDQKEMTGGRPNDWRDPLAYMARPLDGVWATPPYLHNGSVPNLDELLRPVKERSVCFYVGNMLFDQEKVGYVTKSCENPIPTRIQNPDPSVQEWWVWYISFYDKNRFKFAVYNDPNDRRSIPGNANTGHDYQDTPNCKQLEADHRAENGVVGCVLTDQERKAIIEYLKTL